MSQANSAPLQGDELNVASTYAELQQRSVAYHEAGHAVMAAVFGIPFRKVTIRPNKVFAGHVALLPQEPPEFVDPCNPEWIVKEARQYWGNYVRAILAGALAETLYTHCWQQQDGSDAETDESKALDIADYFDPPAKATRWVNRLRFQTLEALRAPQVWAAVNTIALNLVQRKTLSSHRVYTLIRQALPCEAVANDGNTGSGTLFPELYRIVGRAHRRRGVPAA